MFLTTRLRAGAPQIVLTMIVFAMASGILGGLIFYVDNATPQVYDEVTSDIPIDMMVDASYSLQNSNMTIFDIQKIVQEQDLVSTTAVVYYRQEWRWSEDHPWDNVISYMGIDNNFFTAFPNALDLPANNGPLIANTCWVSEAELGFKSLNIGDNYTIEFDTWDEYGPHTHTYVLKIVGSFTSTLFKEYVRWDAPPSSTLGVITDNVTINKIWSAAAEDNYYYSQVSSAVWVSLDKSSLLTSDPATVNEKLSSLKARIEQAVLPYASIGWSGFPLREALQGYISWAVAMRLVSIGFSIPTILMGILLVYYDSTLGSDQIQRDSSTLKTRGASGKQVFFWIMTRSTVVAILGGFGALLTGTLAAILAGTVRTFLEFDLTRLASLTFFAEPITVVIAFIFAFVLGLFASIPIAYRSLVQSIAEAHQVINRRVLLGREYMSTPVAEVAFFAVTMYCLIPLLALSGYAMYNPSSFFALMTILTPILVIFIITATRLASRPTSSIKGRVLKHLRHGRLKVSMTVLAKSVRMHKKTEATAVMFVAMVFAASTLASVSATTGYNHVTSLIRFQVGADISMEVSDTATNVTLDLLDKIRNISGVADASGIVRVTGHALYRQADYSGYHYNTNQTVTVWGIEPSSWLRTAFLLPYFTLWNDPATAFNMIAQDNTSIITSFRPVDHYELKGYQQIPVYSDQMSIQLRHTNKSLQRTNISDCTIIDLMSTSMGYPTYFPGEPNEFQFVIMNLDYVVAVTNKTQVDKFYISLKPDANITQVKYDLIGLSPKSFSKVDVVQEYLDEALESRAGQVVYGIYTLDVLFSMLFLVVGIVIVTTLRTRKLRRSFSILRALGAETSPMGVTLIIDTALTLVVSLLIGSLLGLFLGWAFSNMQLVYTGVNSRLSWLRLPVSLVIPYTLLILIIITAFVISLVANFLVNRLSLNRNIAEEIQYSE
ncbi:MAG: FtsX-like permease family protein [Candidatus Thorarchaeota archaeon]